MLTLAWRNMARRPLRSLLTILGIVIGSGAYLTLVAMSHGMREQAQNVVDLLGTDLTVTRARSPVPWMSLISRAEVAQLRAIPNVQSVSEVVIGTTRAEPRDLFLVFGGDPKQDLLRNLPMIRGRMLRNASAEMVVGDDAAEQLALQPGDAVELAGRQLDVVGVFHTGRGVLDSAAVVDLPVAQSLFGSRQQVSLAFIKAQTSDSVPEVMREIGRRFPRLEATPSASFTSRFEYLNLVTVYARYFATLALLIAAVMIANTVSMNVTERRQEIAVLRSIGWRRSRIALLILGEGMLMIVIGVAIAVPLSALTLRALSAGDAAWAIPAALSSSTIVEGMLVALGAGMVFSSAPLIQGLRVRPAEALRML